MKRMAVYFFSVFALLFVSGCEAIGTIFKAGMWWAFILVALVVFVVLWLFSKGRKK